MSGNATAQPKGSAAGFVACCFLALAASVALPAAVEYKLGNADSGTMDWYHFWAVVTALVDMTAIAGIVFGFGAAVTGRYSGIALSSWNDYSLSRLQMALWTIVVLSGLFTAAKLNLLGYFGPVPADKVLAIAIPPELLAAMGIAAFSTAATPAILSLKAGQTASPAAQAGAQARTAATSAGAGTAMAGNAMGNSTAAGAHWTDIVTGDEVANAGTVDLSKVQQLLVTILLIGTYTLLLLRTFASVDVPGCIDAMPPLNQHFIQLMAVSHAGYLVYKAAPKAGTTGDATTPAAAQAGATPQAAAAGPLPAPPPNIVTVRLAVDAAATTQGLRLTVDGRNAPIPADGCADLPLDIGVAHRIAANGTRGGAAVAGQLAITPTLDDLNKVFEIVLT